MVIPNPLVQGDKVAILASAKRLETSYQQALSLLLDWGLEPIVYESVDAVSGYFAGNDALRISDLQNALDDESIHAILFLRGGYGTTRIIDQIDFSAFRKNPKWFIGFSDITAFLLQSLTFNVPAIHGPVAITLGQEPSSDNVLRKILFGETLFEMPICKTELSKTGQVIGPITGGNLCMVCESIGTSNEIKTEGQILFLEEVGEEFYAVDRMMNKLKRSGKLHQVKGLILGDFSNITDRQSYFNCSIEELVLSYFEGIEMPKAISINAGHERTNLPLLLGCPVQMEVISNVLRLHYLK